MDGYIDNLYVTKELYTAIFSPVCAKYKITMTEMLVLLFLSKSAEYDTASNIVEKLKIAKSHISASVRDLEERGYLQGSYAGHNRRTIHLRLCEEALPIIQEGKQAQNQFLSVIGQGFTEEDLHTITGYIQRMNNNANDYLRKQPANKRR